MASALLALSLTTHTSAQPVVQPLPSGEVQRLNRALLELAKRPRDLAALLEAGNAAIEVNDLEAASGFFQRAREVDGASALADLGLARVALRQGQPVAALALIDQARTKGAPTRQVLAERGLAYDMVGQQQRAQADYRGIPDYDQDPLIIRRLAISYAIEGRLAEFERTLRPQIERRDPAAFRTRTFGLAIMGEDARAVAILEAVMPARLANELSPYLDVMPRLTPAQQAAAANLGIFPSPADIGRDSADILQFAAAQAQAQAQAQAGPAAATGRIAAAPSERIADARLEPRGAPLGAPAASVSANARPAPLEPPASAPAMASAAVPAPVSASAPAPAAPQSVADAFADLGGASAPAVSPATGAVDLARIAIPREAPPAPRPAEPAKPAHPSRIWVQVATGRDLKALGFDWRRLARRAPEQLGDFTAHTVPWGEANRLLAGPLKSASAARELVNALREKGIETFPYTSPEGQEIQELE
ncbi:MAG: SPOR domain-containing protein [Erythrobacter sp.]|nr:SPOR domain-containing protein [Erythrobacter sp.]